MTTEIVTVVCRSCRQDDHPGCTHVVHYATFAFGPTWTSCDCVECAGAGEDTRP